MPKRHHFFSPALLFLISFPFTATPQGDDPDAKRKEYLETILKSLPPELPEAGHVTTLDASWTDWLKRTGELPPDFDALPSMPYLPDPLSLNIDGKTVPITTLEQWRKKREWISGQVQHWITGTFPPAPDNLKAEIVSTQLDGQVTVQIVTLSFGPGHRATMTVKLMIPPGSGPFPVFLTQWNQDAWARIALRRGYIACLYAGSDRNDDSEAYQDIWYPEYDFARLMRRAWGSHRAVDYLYTLPIVDKDKIGMTGHSRNGKQSTMAAAFDDRIKAVISSSGGTGAEDPWRYTNDIFQNETIEEITTTNPFWFHPRLRFFTGREHKLPVDQNLLMALIAPRGLMLSSAATETQGNPWGIEMNFRSLQKVYRFLGVPDHLAIRLRPGRHDTAPRDIESYLDFFDHIFARGTLKPENQLSYDYSFNKWLGLSGETVNPLAFSIKNIDDILIDAGGLTISSISGWEHKQADIQNRIRWALGDEPAGVTYAGPESIKTIPHNDPTYNYDHIARVITREEFRRGIARLVVAHTNGFGDYVDGNLYYPADSLGAPSSTHLPVIIYLHEFSYPSGFGRKKEFIIKTFVDCGYAVFLFDQIGFGPRINEGTFFYQRYPHWSKMGKMVADTRAAIEALAHLEIIDKDRIYAAGYSLGATVALYTAALDNRIQGVISACGFTPLRTAGDSQDVTGLRMYSHLHGLMPRLGFFDGEDARLPFDFHEVLASLAPRPLLVIAPRWNRFAVFEDVTKCVAESGKIYKLYKAERNLELYSPDHHSIYESEHYGFKYVEEVRQELVAWISEHFK